MADVTIYRDPALVNVVVVDGPPPTDQSALVTQLQNDLATYKTFAQGVKDRAQARKDADSAKTEGQDDLDAAANLPA